MKLRKHISLLATLLLAGSAMFAQTSSAGAGAVQSSSRVDASVQAGVDANVSSLGAAVPAEAISATELSSTKLGLGNVGTPNLTDAQKQKVAAATGSLSAEQKQKLASATSQPGSSKQQQLSKIAAGNNTNGQMQNRGVNADSQKISKSGNAAKLQSLQASTAVPKLKSQNASRQNVETDNSDGAPKADSSSIFSLDSGPSLYAGFDPGSRIGLGDTSLDFNPVTSHTSNSSKSDQLRIGGKSDGENSSQASATDSGQRSGDDSARRVRKSSEEHRSRESLHPKSAKQRREDERHAACPSCSN